MRTPIDSLDPRHAARFHIETLERRFYLSAPVLDPYSSIPIGSAPDAVAAVDFNGDQQTDLVVADLLGDQISVLRGNGDGSFQPAGAYSVASPRAIALGDLNHDGHPDIVAAGLNADFVSVLLGNSHGTFQAAQTFLTGSEPTSVALADINGDGNLDVVTADFSAGAVSILLGTGDGSFNAHNEISLGGDVEPNYVALADINQDGTIDIVTSDENYGSGMLSILLNAGNGIFQPAQSQSIGEDTQSMAVGDLNGDGIPDVIAVNSQKDVTVMSGTGDGSFSVFSDYSVSGYPQSVALADLNGDGHVDIVTKDNQDITVLEGNGDLSFGAGQAFSTGGGFLALDGAVAVADLNADGAKDVITGDGTGSGTVSVLLNGTDSATDPNLASTSTVLVSSAPSATAGESITFTAEIFVPQSGAIPTGTVTFFDGDASIGSGSVQSDGTAVLATSALVAGAHSITATYGGDGAYNPSTSAALTEAVTAAPLVTPDHVLESFAKGLAYDPPGTLQVGQSVPNTDFVLAKTWTVDGANAIGLTSPDHDSVLVFPGTDVTDFRDWYSDFSPIGVGSNQYQALRSNPDLSQWIQAQPRLDLTGHSLGGALAQWFAAGLTAANVTIGKVVTFNSPGISVDAAAQFNPGLAGSVTHYIADGDFLSLAGRAYIPGNYKMYSWNAASLDPVHYILEKHMTYLLSSDDSAAAGMSLEQSGNANALGSGFFTYYDSKYRAFLAGIATALALTPGLEALTGLPFALLFRGTSETARSTLGLSLKGIDDLLSAGPVAFGNVGRLANLVGNVLGKIPTAVFGGSKGNATATVSNDGGTPFNGHANLDLYTSTDPTLDGGETLIASMPLSLKLAPGKRKKESLHFSYPSGLADGTYYLLTRIDAPRLLSTGLPPAGSISPSLTIAKPFVDPSVSSQSEGFAASPAAGDNGTISVGITDRGNITAKGTITFNFALAGTGGQTVPLAVTPRSARVSLKPNTTKVFRLRGRIPSGIASGQYVISGSFSLLGSSSDANLANNEITFSSTPITISGDAGGGIAFTNFTASSHTNKAGILDEQGTVGIPGGFTADYTFFQEGTIVEWQIIYSQLLGNTFSFYTNEVTFYHRISTFNHKSMTFLPSAKGATGSLVISADAASVNDLAPGTYFFKVS